MPLHRGAEGPEIHAIGADADRAAPPAGAERHDLIKAIEQAGPFLLIDQPFNLRLVRGEFRLGQPALEILGGLLLVGGVGVDRLKSGDGSLQAVHWRPRFSHHIKRSFRGFGWLSRFRARFQARHWPTSALRPR